LNSIVRVKLELEDRRRKRISHPSGNGLICECAEAAAAGRNGFTELANDLIAVIAEADAAGNVSSVLAVALMAMTVQMKAIYTKRRVIGTPV
jgi:hypothetical protein